MRVLIPTLLSAACLAAVPPALADHDAVRNVGRLEAEGRGVMTADGALVVYGIVAAPAVISIRDRDGRSMRVRVVVTVGRKRVVREGRRVAIPRGRGRFIVSCRDAVIRVSGRRLVVSAAGNAAVRFRGAGSYELDGGEDRRWAREDVITLGGGPPPRDEAADGEDEHRG